MVDCCGGDSNYKGGTKKLMGQIQLTVSLVMIGLFTIAIIGFGLNFANDNNAAVSIADDSEMSSLYSRTQGNVSAFEEDSESQYQSLIETTVGSEGTAPSTGPFAVTPLNAIGVVRNVLETGYIKIFGTGSGFGIFLTALIAIILFMLGLFIYKTLRGMPD